MRDQFFINVAIMLALLAVIATVFLPKVTGKEQVEKNDNMPILSSEVVERISSGDEVFLTYWHKAFAEKCYAVIPEYSSGIYPK